MHSDENHVAGIVSVSDEFDVVVAGPNGIVERWVDRSEEVAMAESIMRLRKWRTTLVVLEMRDARDFAAACALCAAGHVVALIHPEQVRDAAVGGGQSMDAETLIRFAVEKKPMLFNLLDQEVNEHREIDAQVRSLRATLDAERRRLQRIAPETQPEVQQHIDWLVDGIADGELDVRRMATRMMQRMQRLSRMQTVRAEDRVWADKCVLEARLEDFL